MPPDCTHVFPRLLLFLACNLHTVKFMTLQRRKDINNTFQNQDRPKITSRKSRNLVTRLIQHGQVVISSEDEGNDVGFAIL